MNFSAQPAHLPPVAEPAARVLPVHQAREAAAVLALVRASVARISR